MFFRLFFSSLRTKAAPTTFPSSFQLYDEELYKKSKILKLMACGKCNAAVADKYIECDGTLLLIDLVRRH
jgi:hypothetical protein